MKNQLLLLEDIHNVGKKGDLVKVKPGFARNYLLPQKKAIIANTRIVRLQAKLKEERQQQAKVDKKESLNIVEALKDVLLSTQVKVDPAGHMYGSVSANDIIQLIKEEKGIDIPKKAVLLPHPIKETGNFKIDLNLKEDVPAQIGINILPDKEVKPPLEERSVQEEKETKEETKEEEKENPEE